MVKERDKIRAFLYVSMILAVAIGVYAQDIAYFLYNKLTIHLILGLSITTAVSIILFLAPPILVCKFNKRMEIGDKEFNIYLGINVLIGIMISAFSLIVLIAWLG